MTLEVAKYFFLTQKALIKKKKKRATLKLRASKGSIKIVKSPVTVWERLFAK